MFIFKNGYVIGWFYYDKLVLMIVVYFMKVNIYDNICKMGGVIGVVIYFEYIGKGLIYLLIKYVIIYMYEEG